MKTLVIAPHPDDELLGCAGTLLKRKEEGSQIFWLIVTCISKNANWPDNIVTGRDNEINQVHENMGFDDVFRLNYPTASLDTVPLSELVGSFSEVFKKIGPDEVFLPHKSDIHSDHRIVFDIGASCTKWFRYPSVKKVFAYETISETDFNLVSSANFAPNYFVDISDFIEKKIDLLKIYKSELGEFPFPRSIEAIRSLASVRGASSGFKAAEAFELLRFRETTENKK